MTENQDRHNAYFIQDQCFLLEGMSRRFQAVLLEPHLIDMFYPDCEDPRLATVALGQVINRRVYEMYEVGAGQLAEMVVKWGREGLIERDQR